MMTIKVCAYTTTCAACGYKGLGIHEIQPISDSSEKALQLCGSCLELLGHGICVELNSCMGDKVYAITETPRYKRQTQETAKMSIFSNNDDGQLSNEQTELRIDRMIGTVFANLNRNDLLEDRRDAIMACNRWVLLQHLLEPNILALEGFQKSVLTFPNLLHNCIVAAGQDTTIMWDPDDEQFWNKPNPSITAIKLGDWIRRNWKNIKKD